MRLIINADDYGLTSGVSDSIIKLFQANAIASTSVMVCAENIEEKAKKLIISGFSKKAGVHLNTTYAKPISNIEDVKSLVDCNGNFNKSLINTYDIIDLEKEWTSQIEKFIEIFGHKPSHIDTHHGLHNYKEFTSIYLKLAKKYDIAIRGDHCYNEINLDMIKIKGSHMYLSEWSGMNKSKYQLKKYIKSNFKKYPNSVLELLAHPGFCDEELITKSSWNYNRENDYKCLLKIAKEGFYNKNNIKLIDFNCL